MTTIAVTSPSSYPSITPEERDLAERDHEAIMRRLAGQDFAWDYQRSMVDLVFMKGLAAPRIAGLIAGHRYMQARPQKRYDDTAIMIVELVKHGHSSARGAQMIERMNAIHGRFRIRQDDHAYVLTSLMFEPIRWNARFGWRPFTAVERHANYCFWREVGARMHATLPAGYEACEQFNAQYERNEWRRTRASVELAAVLFRLLESWVPAVVRPLVRPALSALVDEDVLTCFDLPPSPRWLRWLVPAVLRLRARALRWWPRRRTSGYYVDRPVRSYVDGYSVAELGPPDDWPRVAAAGHTAEGELAPPRRVALDRPRPDDRA
ncbi:MAG TPA: oxygenase MpaB family protein [Kofleriaceae bacterium]|nr:oxygenase MpaB family protein [Kofleriaceae bacterium]